MDTRWVVTCADHNIYNDLLPAFLGSLFEIAKYTGNVAIIDYGFADSERRKLQNMGIVLIPAMRFYNPIITDRFKTLGENFKNSHEALICEWDCDVFFCDEIDSAFDQIKPGILTATLDATYQHFLKGCVFEPHQEKVKRVLDQVVSKKENKGKVLQGGFVSGDGDTLYTFSCFQDAVLHMEICRDCFGADMVAMNMFQYFFPNKVEICSIKYNCLPDWNLYKENGKFYADGFPESLHAIHVSSPHRNKYYSFYSLYPEIYKEYQEKLKVI